MKFAPDLSSIHCWKIVLGKSLDTSTVFEEAQYFLLLFSFQRVCLTTQCWRSENISWKKRSSLSRNYEEPQRNVSKKSYNNVVVGDSGDLLMWRMTFNKRMFTFCKELLFQDCKSVQMWAFLELLCNILKRVHEKCNSKVFSLFSLALFSPLSNRGKIPASPAR